MTRDVRLALLAERQHGVVSARQLLALRFSRAAVGRRVERALLQRVHHGVYAVGHARLTWRGRLWAAVLACGGPGAAVLSGRTAAAVRDLCPAPSRFDITTLRGSRSTPHIRVHRRRLEPHDIADHDGLAITTPMRTLLDLASTVSAFELERAVHRAAELQLLDAGAVPAARRGSRRLRTALATIVDDEPRITRSDLEEAFLRLVHDHRLPPPLTNHPVNGHTVDAYWPAQRLVVELDSREWHLNETAFEVDRERDVQHTVAGDRVVRLTHRALTGHAGRSAARLQALLAAASQPTRGPRPAALAGGSRSARPPRTPRSRA